MFYCGGRVGIYFGNFKDLSRDLPVLQPTVMICVPRMLNRIYHRVRGEQFNLYSLTLSPLKVITKVKGNWVKSRVLNVALKSKQPENMFKKWVQTGTGQSDFFCLHFSETIKNSIWDKLVFKTVKQSLGGNLKLLLSGSNQISNVVLNFMRNSLGCTVNQAYEMTECSSYITMTMYNDQNQGNWKWLNQQQAWLLLFTGHLGVPAACNAVKLIDIPHLNIVTSETKIGEVWKGCRIEAIITNIPCVQICVKGTNVFSGYYKDYELYQSSVDADGWFHTGDVGEWLPVTRGSFPCANDCHFDLFQNGCLKYIDRKKDIFLTNDGKLIAPNKIENIYIQSIYVGQCYVDIDMERVWSLDTEKADIKNVPCRVSWSLWSYRILMESTCGAPRTTCFSVRQKLAKMWFVLGRISKKEFFLNFVWTGIQEHFGQRLDQHWQPRRVGRTWTIDRDLFALWIFHTGSWSSHSHCQVETQRTEPIFSRRTRWTDLDQNQWNTKRCIMNLVMKHTNQ